MKIKIYILALFFIFASINSHAFTVGDPSAMLPPTYEAYAADPAAADQGVTDNTNVTIKNLVDNIGTSKSATIILSHSGAANTTTYTLTTSETVPANIVLWIEEGAQIDGAGTLTIDPASIDARPGQQIFGSSLTVSFSSSGIRYSEWWGIDGAADEVEINKAIASATGGIVELFPKTYTISVGTAVAMANGVELRGQGYNTLLDSSGTRTAAILSISGKTDVTIRNLRADASDDTAAYGIIQIDGNSSEIRIQNCWLENGYSGIWLNPGDSETITDVEISGNMIDSMSSTAGMGSIMMGHATTNYTATMTDIRIIDNEISNASGDGIKTGQDVKDLTITGNIIHNSTYDCIDLYVSGENVTIAGNVLRNSAFYGIDFKHFEANYARANWGEDRNVSISSNVIYDNEIGIRMSCATSGNESDNKDRPYWFNISDNVITANDDAGIWGSVSYAIISDNIITGNATEEDSDTGYGIRLDAESDTYKMKGNAVLGNLVMNNGDGTNNSIGIAAIRQDGLVLDDNVVQNNSDFDNANQTHGIYIYSTCVGVTIKNNLIDGHTTDIVCDIRDILGEDVNVSIGSIAAGSDTQFPIFIAPERCIIVDCNFTIGNTITADAVDYVTFQLYDKASDGNSSNTIAAAVDTSATTINDFDTYAFGAWNASHRYLARGDVVAANVAHTASGQNVTGLLYQLVYVTY